MTEQAKISKKIFKFSQKALIYNSEKKEYLLLKAKFMEGGHKKAFAYWKKKYGPWDLPGGHMDENEKDLEKSFAREILEEIGVAEGYKNRGICLHCIVENPQKLQNSLLLVHFLEYDQDEIVLSDEHEAYQWMSAQEVQEEKEIKQWIKDAVNSAEEKIEQMDSLNSWRRCVADFDNYKKRQAENQKEFTKYAAEGVISEMLPILDNFHAATDHIPEVDAESPWVTGIMFIQKQMEKVFEENNVTRIDVNIGDEFDPFFMEAVKEADDENVDEDSTVKKIAQNGYRINEKILRPARVVLK